MSEHNTQQNGGQSALSTAGTVQKRNRDGQLNQYGQNVRYSIELENGESEQAALYLRRIMRGQDLEAWKAEPAGLNRFVRNLMAEYWQRVQVRIITTEGRA